MKRAIIATGTVAIVGGLVTAALVTSCDPDCVTPDKPSVIVRVVDEASAGDKLVEVKAEEVWYEWTDEESGETVKKQAECVDDECSEWMLGTGRPGTFDYHAKICGKQYDASIVLEYNEAGCEVDTQMVDLKVSTVDCVDDVKAPGDAQPVDSTSLRTADDFKNRPLCTLEARASVIVSTYAEVDGRMLPMPAEDPVYQWDGGHDQRKVEADCIDEECTQFIAGYEKAGRFKVSAKVCGHPVHGEVTVEKTANGCHVETEFLTLATDKSDDCPRDFKTPTAVKPPPEGFHPSVEACTGERKPSAFLTPVQDGGDVWMPLPTDKLVYVHDNERYDGYCVQPTQDGKCTWWATGMNMTGRFRAYTEKCGLETAVDYTVELSEDGCTPVTQVVPVFVDTRGCITAPPPHSDEIDTPSSATEVKR